MVRRLVPWARGVLFVAGIILVAATFLPFVPTDAWWIRFLDFPRFQYEAALAIVAAAFLGLVFRRGVADAAFVAVLCAALGYNIAVLVPYTALAPSPAMATTTCRPGARLRIVIVNVQASNRNADKLLDIIGAVVPDVFLAMETNEYWNEKLAALDAMLPHSVKQPGGRYFGMHLFSRYELVSPEVRFPAGNDVPAIYTGIRLPTGQTVTFYGVHPRPPQIAQGTQARDTQIRTAAAAARDSATPSIIAGDLNAVPWEDVVRRAIDTGRLLDPRIGRGFFATFDADDPALRWPLDQILFQSGFALLDLRRLPAFGSDHFPFMADLCARG